MQLLPADGVVQCVMPLHCVILLLCTRQAANAPAVLAKWQIKRPTPMLHVLASWILLQYGKHASHACRLAASTWCALLYLQAQPLRFDRGFGAASMSCSSLLLGCRPVICWELCSMWCLDRPCRPSAAAAAAAQHQLLRPQQHLCRPLLLPWTMLMLRCRQQLQQCCASLRLEAGLGPNL